MESRGNELIEERSLEDKSFEITILIVTFQKWFASRLEMDLLNSLFTKQLCISSTPLKFPLRIRIFICWHRFQRWAKRKNLGEARPREFAPGRAGNLGNFDYRRFESQLFRSLVPWNANKINRFVIWIHRHTDSSSSIFWKKDWIGNSASCAPRYSRWIAEEREKRRRVIREEKIYIIFRFSCNYILILRINHNCVNLIPYISIFHLVLMYSCLIIRIKKNYYIL